MNASSGEATGIAGESSPSVGLAVVDSMAARQIKGFDGHSQGFHVPGATILPASGEGHL
jgi:hypothetical protein